MKKDTLTWPVTTRRDLFCEPVPSATYRLQFNRQFTFRHATRLVCYLHELGISDIYASPLTAARPGSSHGYDVTDYSRLNPEIGTEEDFLALARRLREHGMGLLLDVVPNHMCIVGGTNQWWNDVLENGPGSPCARAFDIDWLPPKGDLTHKVLLPMLGAQYGRTLENQELRLEYEQGGFFIRYYETRLPVAPRSCGQILQPVLERLRAGLNDTPEPVLELESILTALSYLPPRTVTAEPKVRERQREKEIIKRRLHELTETDPTVRSALQTVVEEFNGIRGRANSFDQLERLLADQGYRLSHWRVAADEINYRRFFDINELAAIRVEEPEVFAAVHELALKLIREGAVTGLRIDHVDGLFDPEQYLHDLQTACQTAWQQSLGAAAAAESSAAGGSAQVSVQSRAGGLRSVYIVVEKVLGHDELLRPDWAVAGTTGYGFLNLLNGIFIEPRSRRAFQRLYERFTGQTGSFADLVYDCKKLILRVALSSELHVLARRLDRISEQHRYSRDFTLNSLQYALGEVIACFPVYRTYLRPAQATVSGEDQRHIRRAIREAIQRNPAISPSIFEFIGSLLLLENPDGLSGEQTAERRNFVMRFQQLTGPVMAKGLEDTAFYRYFPLASLNEVGGDPTRFGLTVDVFHQQNQQRMIARPHGLSAGSTHDTKRSEDVRARLNVLTEIPTEWYRAILRWQNLNRPHKTRHWSGEVPDANVEYLIYQTIIGVWPPGQFRLEDLPELTRRVEEYIVKAIREAKVHTSWISPDEEYEQGVRQFIRAILAPEPENRFPAELDGFQQPVARAGIFNSLSQTLLRITSPGVPDFYQGTELWDFSLVDPDNRRPVDFERREHLLSEIIAAERGNLSDFLQRLLQQPEDGCLKMYLIRRALQFRRRHQELFVKGTYQPLRVTGKARNHVIAFARSTGRQTLIVAAGRFFIRLGANGQLPPGREVWGDTKIVLDGKLETEELHEVFTETNLRLIRRDGRVELSLADVFARLPVAILAEGPGSSPGRISTR